MSAFKSLIIAAVVSVGFAGVAQARDAIFTAKLETPVAEQTRVIAQSTIWTCSEDTCLARPNHSVSVRACRQLAREAGVRVVSYGHEGDELTAEELARCNGESVTQQARN